MRQTAERQLRSTQDTYVAIVGAGPYGLSLAAHLRAKNVDHRVFGRPMQVWAEMPAGMYLKSYGFASNISTLERDPELELPTYCRERGLEDYEPIEIRTFAEYGAWFQRQAVPELEPVNVASISHDGEQFALTLESGERFRAQTVVLALGLSYFENVPEVLRMTCGDRLSHTADHADFANFRGQEVAVIGAGQSALQAAALLLEAGASPTIIARGEVHWGWQGEDPRSRSLLQRIRAPQTVLGPGRDNWVLEHFPMLLHYLPDTRRMRFSEEHFGPSGAWWLRGRVDGQVPTLTDTAVTGATAFGSSITLDLIVGSERQALSFDHIIAGTGYRVDVDRLAILDPELRTRVSRLDGSPRLSKHFESSVRGLFFIGPASVASFGPLFRFVSGSYATAPVVSTRLVKRARSDRLPDAPTKAFERPSNELPG